MGKNDGLIFVIFIAFWAFSFLAKKLTSQQKSAEKKGFTLKVLEFIASLKEVDGSEMNVQEPTYIKPVPAPIVSEEFVSLYDEEQPMRRHSKKFPAPASVVAAKPEMKYKNGPLLSDVVRRKKMRGLRFSKKKLRQAVVWAEIIGTPVGLRDS